MQQSNTCSQITLHHWYGEILAGHIAQKLPRRTDTGSLLLTTTVEGLWSTWHMYQLKPSNSCTHIPAVMCLWWPQAPSAAAECMWCAAQPLCPADQGHVTAKKHHQRRQGKDDMLIQLDIICSAT